MDEFEFWIRFVLATFANWRVCHLLASEDGPWDVVALLRARLANSALARLIDCFGCLSIWVAIPLAFFVSNGFLNLVMTWLALSGSAFLLDRMNPEPVVIERIPEASTGGS